MSDDIPRSGGGGYAWLVASVVVFCAVFVAGGWILSAARMLCGIGYGLVALVACLAAFVYLRRYHFEIRCFRLSKGWSIPRLVFSVILLGGGITAFVFPPNNIDAITYRLPRLLHWAEAGGWLWLDTDNLRVNYSAAVSEWLGMPVWVWFSDLRGLVWFNLFAYAALPGLFFSCGWRLGLSRRTAKAWMWIFPLAPGLALQAATSANDITSVAFYLCALFLGAESVRVGSRLFLVASFLAMSLCSGVKTSNLPLVLPWLTVVAPAILRAPWAVAAILVPSAVVSALPTLVLNQVYAGHWSGDPLNEGGLRPDSWWVAGFGNLCELLVQTLSPPIFPIAGLWNEHASRISIETFPRFTLRLGELAQEEWAGMGLMIVVAGGFWWGLSRARSGRLGSLPKGFAVLVALASCVFFGAIQSEMPARLLLPYLPLWLFIFLSIRDVGMGERALRWRAVGWGVGFGALLPVALAPTRPWLPIALLANKYASGGRIDSVYSVYARRHDYASVVRDMLPDGTLRLGIVGTPDDSDLSFWLPYGDRVVVLARDPARLLERQVDFIIACEDALSISQRARISKLLDTGAIEAAGASLVHARASKPPELWRIWRVRA